MLLKPADTDGPQSICILALRNNAVNDNTKWRLTGMKRKKNGKPTITEDIVQYFLAHTHAHMVYCINCRRYEFLPHSPFFSRQFHHTLTHTRTCIWTAAVFRLYWTRCFRTYVLVSMCACEKRWKTMQEIEIGKEKFARTRIWENNSRECASNACSCLARSYIQDKPHSRIFQNQFTSCIHPTTELSIHASREPCAIDCEPKTIRNSCTTVKKHVTRLQNVKISSMFWFGVLK